MSRAVLCLPVWMSLLFLVGCATRGSRLGASVTGRQVPAHYAQSMDSATSGCLRNPACYAQTGDEAVIPWVSRAANAVRSGVAVMRLLDAAEVARVEQVLVTCSNEANLKVNEEEFGKGNSPTEEQCNEVVRREKGEDVNRAMELGTKKHAAAFECVKRELGESLSKNVTLQPRYKYDPALGRWLMLDPKLVAKWLEDKLFDLLLGTLAPDIVVHESGNPNKVQRVYDYKFPCLPSRKARPRWRYSQDNQSDQGTRYMDALGGEAKPRLITPQLGVQ